MTSERPSNNPERREILEDNARKFVVETISSQLLQDAGPTSFTLATDWLETGEDSETKLAHKTFTDGTVQILLIAKTTKDGNRTSEKKTITNKEYTALLDSSILRIAKQRHEFTYTQYDSSFDIKYDEFEDSTLRILEVDATTEEARSAFDVTAFPAKLTEVTGNLDYYGYRVARVI